MPVALKGSNSGQVTLTVPTDAGTNTLTLPAATGTVNTSGAVNEVPAGSASAPSIYTTGDSNTGVFFPAADTIGWTTGGTERARVTSTGVLQVGNNAGTGEVFAQNSVKVWGVINSGTTAFINSFGASSVSKTSTGVFQVSFSRTLGSSRFGLSGSTYASAAFIAGGNESTTGTQVRTYNNSGTLIDTDSMFMVVGGS